MDQVLSGQRGIIGILRDSGDRAVPPCERPASSIANNAMNLFPEWYPSWNEVIV
jgi:hypothetical protein